MISTILSLLATVSRFIVGVVSLCVAWVVLDNIHDRNTEIVVACLGLLYCYIFMISRRWQYYGLTVFSVFGVTVSRLLNEPYDQLLRDEVGLPRNRTYMTATIVFVSLTELLCTFRLATSLLGHGWDRLADPLRDALYHQQIEAMLRLL